MGVGAGKRKRVYERDNNCCVVCGTEDNLTIDHKIARMYGGSDDEDNLQTMCGRCNSVKGNRPDNPTLKEVEESVRKRKRKNKKKYSKKEGFHHDIRQARKQGVIRHEPGCDPVFGCVGHCQAKDYGHSILGSH